MRTTLLIAALILCGFPSAGKAQGFRYETWTIEGIVVDQDGRSIAGAEVKIFAANAWRDTIASVRIPSAEGFLVWKGISDAGGRFKATVSVRESDGMRFNFGVSKFGYESQPAKKTAQYSLVVHSVNARLVMRKIKPVKGGVRLVPKA